MEATLPWILFNLFVLAMLAVDLGVFHRNAHEVKAKEAAAWSAVWVALALLFCVGVWQVKGPQAGLEFLTGYLIEKALSVDNIFVFVLVFSWFAVPPRYQHRVLFWGILGALSNRVLELGPEGPVPYGGGYREYVARTGREAPGLRELARRA